MCLLLHYRFKVQYIILNYILHTSTIRCKTNSSNFLVSEAFPLHEVVFIRMRCLMSSFFSDDFMSSYFNIRASHISLESAVIRPLTLLYVIFLKYEFQTTIFQRIHFMDENGNQFQCNLKSFINIHQEGMSNLNFIMIF